MSRWTSAKTFKIWDKCIFSYKSYRAQKKVSACQGVRDTENVNKGRRDRNGKTGRRRAKRKKPKKETDGHNLSEIDS